MENEDNHNVTADYADRNLRTRRDARERSMWRTRAIFAPNTFVLRSSRGVRYEFQTTTLCCPQQWEAKVDGRKILHARCRGGCFSANYYPNGDLDTLFGVPVHHLLMEVYLIPNGFDRVPGTELEAAETVDGMDERCLELPNKRCEMAYLRRAIDLCDQWRFNDVAGVPNVSPFSYRDDFNKRLRASYLVPAPGIPHNDVASQQ